MTLEHLRLPRPSMGEFPWTKSCKPAIGNHTTHSPDSTSRILPDKTNQRAPSIWAPSLQPIRWCLLPTMFQGRKQGGHDAGNHLDGECQNPDTIEWVFTPFKVTWILFLFIIIKFIYLMYFSFCKIPASKNSYREFLSFLFLETVFLSFTFSVSLKFTFLKICVSYQVFLHTLFHCTLCTLFFRYFFCMQCLRWRWEPRRCLSSPWWYTSTSGELENSPQSLMLQSYDLIRGFLLLHPGLRMLACDGCCLCQMMNLLASVSLPSHPICWDSTYGHNR